MPHTVWQCNNQKLTSKMFSRNLLVALVSLLTQFNLNCVGWAYSGKSKAKKSLQIVITNRLFLFSNDETLIIYCKFMYDHLCMNIIRQFNSKPNY